MHIAPASPFTPQQFYGFQAETEATVILSQRGIEELWALGPANDFVHLPLQLLAQGFERLLKLTYALAWMKKHDELPATTVFKTKFGHRIDLLTDELVQLVETEPDYANRPAIQEDLEFLRSDPLLRRHLQLLTDFGTCSRYYHFEEFLGVEHIDEADPERTWDRMEMDIIETIDGGMALLHDPRRADELQRLLIERITGVLDRFGRAVTRMWTLGALHPQAMRMTGLIGGFLFLHDRELGTDPSQRRRR